jgi:hypothetical protein
MSKAAGVCGRQHRRIAVPLLYAFLCRHKDDVIGRLLAFELCVLQTFILAEGNLATP